MRLVVVVGLLAVGACSAQVAGQGDGPVVDMAQPPDLALPPPDEAMPLDLTPPGPTCPDASSAEDCHNNCDDDHNGFTDDDDPACAPQVVATFEGGSSMLMRLSLDPVRAMVLDGNAVASGAHGTYNGGFTPQIAWLALDDATSLLRRIMVALTGGTVTQYSPGYSTRDVCIFNGELIVVDANGKLHRFAADGKTELGQVVLGSPTTVLLSACASDGNRLYVATHDVSGMPTQFLVLDKTFKQVLMPLSVPKPLQDNGYDRCLDFAWTQAHGGVFYGLFASSQGELRDSKLHARQVFPFDFDGGAGPPIDAGLLHAIGEFIP